MSSSPAKPSTPEREKPRRTLRNTPTKHKDTALLKGIEDEGKLRKAQPKTTVISLEESDEDTASAIVQTVPPSQKDTVKASAPPALVKPRKPPVVEDEEDDPFLREVQRKAREKAQQQQRVTKVEESRVQSAVATERTETTGLNADPPPSAETQKGKISILVQTRIPGTKDLVVQRQASGSLRAVKEYWTQRHNLEPAFAQQVLFTWRGTKLYNSSTTQSLIDILKRENGIPLESDEDPSKGKIMLEAVTQDILDQQAREKEKLAAAAEAGTGETGEEGHVETGC